MIDKPARFKYIRFSCVPSPVSSNAVGYCDGEQLMGQGQFLGQGQGQCWGQGQRLRLGLVLGLVLEVKVRVIMSSIPCVEQGCEILWSDSEWEVTMYRLTKFQDAITYLSQIENITVRTLYLNYISKQLSNKTKPRSQKSRSCL